jgi:hypothetical protein
LPVIATSFLALMVRVPLDWIRDNHATLMALSEMANKVV